MRAGSAHTGRTTTLSQAAGRAPADALAPSTGAHPWEERMFPAGRGTQRTLDEVVPVEPQVMLEAAVDVARHSTGRRRLPVRPHRIRTDVNVP
ncbi:hypothetical protein QWJ26_39255 [Streptomyces sp. CSDS2]|uniref:hypothetical protein n=1 Tax=Streptomyces sp. CSDS2 TaxID=3055051 RepID=UPI0025B16F2F|nr:hypothetical protein [Streptomyces sp. CSDS2]MDN3265738.1 hypothetical protein [Streptomyces sp. CSDS2]